MTEKKITIGLFGFGVVGKGIYDVLQASPNWRASIKKICIKDPTKKRKAPASLFTTNPQELLDDPEINVIVEAISDSLAGFTIITTAIKEGKAVVSASKKVIAENLLTLLNLQQQAKTPFLYEAAVCASIPIIRNLEEYYDNDLLHAFTGIVNGSTNYILTKIFKENLTFKAALIQAQQSGFAEADPSLDVMGIDAANKTILLLLHAFGLVIKQTDLLCSGIQQIQRIDIQFANEKGFTIKLVSQAKKLKNNSIACVVLPQFITAKNQLFHTNDAFNCVLLESSFAEQQFFYGKGAGALPTASALLSDISALRYGYRYGYRKWQENNELYWETTFYLRVYISFTHIDNVAMAAMEKIEEWHDQKNRSYLIGIIAAQKLQTTDWWKKNGNSLILLPDAFVENVDTEKLKARSLAIAIAD